MRRENIWNTGVYRLLMRHRGAIIISAIGLFALLGSWALLPEGAGNIFHYVLVAFGSILLTIGIGHSLSLNSGLRVASDFARMLDAARQAGIKDIFISRLQDRDRFRAAVDRVLPKSRLVKLVGIAFNQIFDSREGKEYTLQVRHTLIDPRIPVEVLMLDPRMHRRSGASRDRGG
jgi:hypothetical protein